MERTSMGNIYLLGPDSDIWSNPDVSDLIALSARHSDDPFTTWVTDTVIHWWHRLIGKYFRVRLLALLVHNLPAHSSAHNRVIQQPDTTPWSANTVSYSQAGLTRLTSLIGTLLASLLPVASIIVLYSISSNLVRLIVIGLFTAGFSISLKLVTNAKLVDVFTATAAWVFVVIHWMYVIADETLKIYCCSSGFRWDGRE